MKNSGKNVQLVAQESTGLLIVPSKKNPTYGSIQLRTEATIMNNGFLRRERRVCFLNGEIEHLEAWLSSEKLRSGSFIEGQIIKKTSLQPFYEGQKPRINPTTGEILLDKETGKEVYLEYQYTTNMNATDHWVYNDEEELLESIDNIENAEQSF